jgi:predicted HicB family RNase H-like nuclease
MQAREKSVPDDSGNPVSLSVRVKPDLRRRLRIYAAATGISVQECVQAALTSWLTEHETELRDKEH